MQQRIYLVGTKSLHAFLHGFVHGDLDLGIKLMHRVRRAAEGMEHTDLQHIYGRHVVLALGHQCKRCLNEILGDDAGLAAGAGDGAAEGQDHVIGGIVQRILQGGFFYSLECSVVAGLLSRRAHEINADPNDLPGIRILVEDRTAVRGHTNRECLARIVFRSGLG